MSLYLDQVRTIVWKDLVMELRTRERLVAMGAFAVLAAVLFSFSIDTATTRPQDIAAGLMAAEVPRGRSVTVTADKLVFRLPVKVGQAICI